MTLLAIRSLWREMRADWFETRLLANLFAAGAFEDEAAPGRRPPAMRALATLLRHWVQIERKDAGRDAALNSLSHRRLAPLQPAPTPPANDATVRDKPVPLPNCHEHRALTAIGRRRTI